MLATPTLHTEDPESWKLTAIIFGKNERPAVLYEENEQFNAEILKVEITWDDVLKRGNVNRENTGKIASHHYTVIDWQVV